MFLPAHPTESFVNSTQIPLFVSSKFEYMGCLGKCDSEIFEVVPISFLKVGATTFSNHWVLCLRDREGETSSRALLGLAAVHVCQGPAMCKSHTQKRPNRAYPSHAGGDVGCAVCKSGENNVFVL